jgi:hypothetical protein
MSQLSSTVGWDSIRSDKLRRLRRQLHRPRQLRRLPQLHGVRLRHGRRHRDRHRRGKHRRDQLQRLFDKRRHQ